MVQRNLDETQNLEVSEDTIKQAAEILSCQDVNVVFGCFDSEWIFRRSSIPLREIPVVITEALGQKVGGEFLIALRKEHTTDRIATALREVLSTDQSVPDAFHDQGIPAYGSGQFKKILLIPPRGNYDGGPAPVVSPHRGVEQIAAYLLEHTIDVDARGFNPNLAGLDRLEQLLRDEFIHVIGMSFLPITLRNDAEVIDCVVAASPDSLVVGGGLNIGQMPHDQMIQAVPFDLMIAGAGERTLKAILESVPLEGKRGGIDLVARFAEVPNLYLYHHQEKRITQTLHKHADPPPTNVDVMKRNIPYERDDLTHHTHYQRQKKTFSQHNTIPYHLVGNRPFYVLNSDHCFHRCNFCSIRREKIKPSGPQAIVAEIADALSSGDSYDSVHFSDNDFFAFPEQVFGICEKLIGAGLEAVPKYCKGCADEVTPEMLRLLRKAGFLMIGYGIETFDDRILKAMNKQIRAAQNEDALQWTLEAGMKPGLNLIAFSPWETEASLWNTIERSLFYVQQGAYLNLMPAMYTQFGDDFSSEKKHRDFIEYLNVSFKSTGQEMQLPYRVKLAPDMESLRQKVRTREQDLAAEVKTTYFDAQAILSQAVQSLIFVSAFLEIRIERYPKEAACLSDLVALTNRFIAQTVDWEKRKVIVAPPEELTFFQPDFLHKYHHGSTGED